MTNRPKQRYTAFIDILGFQHIISNMENEPDVYEKIETALINISNIDKLRQMVRSVESDPEAVVEFERHQDLHVQTFSDCILISAADNETGLLAVTAMSALTYWMLFSHGFFSRGAITKDELNHDNNIVFGKALVRAYSLEQKVAIFPRIILSKEISDDLTNKARHIPIKVDFDGQPFLDVFNPQAKKIINTWNERQPDKKSVIKLENGSQELIKQIKTINDPSIQQKLNWLRNYFNSCARNLDLNKI